MGYCTLYGLDGPENFLRSSEVRPHECGGRLITEAQGHPEFEPWDVCCVLTFRPLN
jgi:hypothetical protein